MFGSVLGEAVVMRELPSLIMHWNETVQLDYFVVNPPDFEDDLELSAEAQQEFFERLRWGLLYSSCFSSAGGSDATTSCSVGSFAVSANAVSNSTSAVSNDDRRSDFPSGSSAMASF